MEGMLSFMVYICCIGVTVEYAECSELPHVVEHNVLNVYISMRELTSSQICFCTDVIVTGYRRVSNAPIAAVKGGVHNTGHG